MSAVGPISEVILYAADIDRLTAFYVDVLGLDVAAGSPDSGFVRFDAGRCDLCVHAGGERDSDETAPKVVFSVDDVEAARDRLRSEGVELGDIREPAPGTRVCDGVDPEGNKFSLESTVSEA